MTRFLKSIFSGLVAALLLMPSLCLGQWTLNGDFNLAIPITSYHQVYKPGHGFNLEAQKAVSDKLALGLHLGFSRFVKLKPSPLDTYDPKVTVAPVLATIEYQPTPTAFVRPFVSGAIGASIYAFSYTAGSTNANKANASFTLVPSVGLRLAFTKSFLYYVKGSMVLLTDGPPKGVDTGTMVIPFPKSNSMTGYGAIAFGVSVKI
jgi:hypothetical protein